jgi:acetyl esterase/lipase
MDLFLPKAADEPTACVIVIQGGGFAAQDGQKFRRFAEYFSQHGFAAALIAYRGRPDHEYRDTVADVKAAVRYVRKVSTQYNIDSDRIGAMGRSAGGTLAAVLGVTGGVEELEGDAGPPGFSSRIQAAVALAGVFDFVSRFTDKQQIALQPKVDSKIVSNGQWIGPPFSPTDEHWLRASAINHVDEEDPPILFLSCRDDATVPWIQSQEMFEAMKEAGADPAIRLYETGGHSFGTLGEEPMAEMVRFFKNTL